MSRDCITCPLRTPAKTCFHAMCEGRGLEWTDMLTECLYPEEQAHARHMATLKAMRSTDARREYLAAVRAKDGDAVADRLGAEYHAWHTTWRPAR